MRKVFAVEPDPHDPGIEWRSVRGELELHQYGTRNWWVYHHPLNASMRAKYPETPERVAVWVALKLGG